MPIPSRRRRLYFQRFLRFFLPVFGAPAGADSTPPEYSAGEAGDESNLVVAVTFDEAIESGTADYLSGVTIKRNGVSVTPAGAALQPSERVVFYTLSSGDEADANDEVTWEYSDTLGDIADLAGNQMADVAAQAVANNVGEHLRFDHPANSMQLATLGVL